MLPCNHSIQVFWEFKMLNKIPVKLSDGRYQIKMFEVDMVGST